MRGELARGQNLLHLFQSGLQVFFFFFFNVDHFFFVFIKCVVILLLLFMFWCFGHKACRILAPWSGIILAPVHWKAKP